MPTLKVLVAGTFQDTEGYPNVQQKNKIFVADDLYDTSIYNRPVSLRIDYRSTFSVVKSLLRITLGLLINSVTVVFAIVKNRKTDIVYVPYPAVHIVWLLGLLPLRFRPGTIVADAFISLYDTVVIDRKLICASSILAKILRSLERRAYGVATVVITDTEENSRYYSTLFSLPVNKFIAIPLSIDESAYNTDVETEEYAQVHTTQKVPSLNVLFVGTMVPLHGVEYVCKAIKMLEDASSSDLFFAFTFVGSGQVDDILDEFISVHQKSDHRHSITRIKDWVATAELSDKIRMTDLCLGIFGREGKSDRVWPFKNYCYLACGKPLVTGSSTTSNRFASTAAGKAFLTVDVSNPDSLAKVLVDLAENKTLLAEVGSNGKRFYDQYLSNHAATMELSRVLSSLVSSRCG